MRSKTVSPIVNIKMQMIIFVLYVGTTVVTGVLHTSNAIYIPSVLLELIDREGKYMINNVSRCL
jgi:hypothetical protein